MDHAVLLDWTAKKEEKQKQTTLHWNYGSCCEREREQSNQLIWLWPDCVLLTVGYFHHCDTNLNLDRVDFVSVVCSLS